MKTDLLKIIGVDDVFREPWEPDRKEQRLNRRQSRKHLLHRQMTHFFFGRDFVKYNDDWLDAKSCRTIMAVAAVDPESGRVVEFGEKALLKLKQDDSLVECWPFRNLEQAGDIVLIQCIYKILEEAAGTNRSLFDPEIFFYCNDSLPYSDIMRLKYLARMVGCNAKEMCEDPSFMMFRFGTDIIEGGADRRIQNEDA